MKRVTIFAVATLAMLIAGLSALAQSDADIHLQPRSPRPRNAASETTGQPSGQTITVPAGTKIALVLRQAIYTKNAHVGDPIYAATNFPVVQDDRVVIPSGTYVQGKISEIKRAGGLRGKTELLFHFTTLIFPSGYTVSMPGSVDNLPDAEHARVKGPEGTVQQDGGDKAKTVGAVATGAATGTTVGALATRSGTGALAGAGLGGAAGLAIAALTRDKDVHLDNGTSVQMVLSRPLALDEGKLPR